ncbi:MAG TPA: cobyric acid synthase [Spirochaetales bacterium]|nr:cobyric acid synthase [Spirochaetales bacterium]
MITENKHGGNMRKHLEHAYALGWKGSKEEFIDASANLNPLGPPPWINEVIFSSHELLYQYPDPEYVELLSAVANYLPIPPEKIVFGNGADEIMFALARMIAKPRGLTQPEPTARALVAAPAYSSYREALTRAGLTVIEVPYQSLFVHHEEAVSIQEFATCWIGAPNNPDGAVPPQYPQSIITLANNFPQTFFVIDEAFIEFTDFTSLAEIKSLPDNIFIIRSMTKIFAVPGLRIGFAIVPEAYKSLIREEIPNWPLNTVAAQFALKTLSHPDVQNYVTTSKQFINKEKQRIRQALSPYYELSEAHANFYCIKLKYSKNSAQYAYSQYAENSHTNYVDYTNTNCTNGSGANQGATPEQTGTDQPNRTQTGACQPDHPYQALDAASRLEHEPACTDQPNRTQTGACQPDHPLSKLRTSLIEFLLKSGIAVRDVSNYTNNDEWICRIAIRTQKENDAIISALTTFATLSACTSSRMHSNSAGSAVGNAFSSAAGSEPSSSANSIIYHVSRNTSIEAEKFKIKKPSRAIAIMIQGCSSSAGKSIITAALCRILRNRGFDVAPYKAQNMSNNSAVTRDGFEIGRAQAVQALACGLEPDPRMNPVLIKPEGNMESQVLVMGKPWQRKTAQGYYQHKNELAAIAQDAYDSLAREYEVIVLEGAGSPAEINLKSHDFVNMQAAIYADADVYLVGDIDRGGVFASFLGHIATFSHTERNLLKGFIINKFRGDATLLAPAYELLARYTSVPVIGCVPYFKDIVIPEEDEATFPVPNKAQKRADELPTITLGIIMFPHVSNFTDFEPFAYEPYVKIKKIVNPSDCAEIDALILPGSKTTVRDYLWLEETGLARVICEQADQGTIIMGICGGLQMLGTEIHDPDHVESDHTVTKSLALLPLVTTFSKNKQLARGTYAITQPDTLFNNEMGESWQNAKLIQELLQRISEKELSGYEIHHGITMYSEPDYSLQAISLNSSANAISKKPTPFIFNAHNNPVAWCYKNIIGTYLHGIFENDELRTAFLNCIRARKNLQEQQLFPVPTTDAELEKLSNYIASYIDTDTIVHNLMKQTNRKAYPGWS